MNILRYIDYSMVLGSNFRLTIGSATSSEEGEEDDHNSGRRHDADDDGESLPGSIW